jgi:Fic family protein
MSHNPKNSRSPKEEKLEELLFFLFEIFPKQETINPFYKINLKEYPSKYSHLHQLLTHFFTLIYQNNRTLENQKFITKRDDVLASLQVLEIISLEAYRDKNQITESCFEKLKNNTTPNQVFARKFIEGIIQKRKSQTSRIINEMVEKGYLERVGGFRNKGFLYQIITFKEVEKVTNKVEKPTSKVDIFEGFTDFDDNENIDSQYSNDNFWHHFKK